MDQIKARSNPSTQSKIQIKKLAWVWIGANPELGKVLKSRLRVLQDRSR